MNNDIYTELHKEWVKAFEKMYNFAQQKRLYWDRRSEEMNVEDLLEWGQLYDEQDRLFKAMMDDALKHVPNAEVIK